MNMNKVCWDCGEKKSITLFYLNKSRSDGRQSRCIFCQNEYHNNVYYPKNRDDIINRINKNRVGKPRPPRKAPPARLAIFNRIYQIVHSVLLKYGELQTNLSSVSAQENISKEIVKRLKRLDLK